MNDKNMTKRELQEEVLEQITGGSDYVEAQYTNFAVGTKVAQNEFPSDYQGGYEGVVSAVLGEGMYEVTWNNGVKMTYSESRIASMVAAWFATH